MVLKIEHRTIYIYSKKIFLEPHIFRLQPKNNCNQRVKDFSIFIKPGEDGKTFFLDTAENDSIAAWFSGLHDSLEIESTSVVETLRTHPFDYILLNDRFAELPFEYTENDARLLAPYMRKKHVDSVKELAREMLETTGYETQSFLTHLTSHIHTSFTQILREVGKPWESDTTIKNASGSCRDLTVLFIDVCRAAGLAARFVSGYAYEEDMNTENQLHSWAQVYIPGGGWRGFDPSVGLAASDQHVALVSGPTHGTTLPVEGSFRGTDATSVLTYEISISLVE